MAKTEICPNCSNAEDNYLMGMGENFTLYYNCNYCGHDFVIDGSKYINEEDEELHYEEVLRDS